MEIIFGLALDDPAWPRPAGAMGGRLYAGPKVLLQVLEAHLGLSRPDVNNDYLRIEQYRQALRRHLTQETTAFYRRSFEADQFATATELLTRRDELLLAGWRFDGRAELPTRLATLQRVEGLLHQDPQNPWTPGFADRFLEVSAQLPDGRHPIRQLDVVEPEQLLPGHWQRLFQQLAVQGLAVNYRTPAPLPDDNDLGAFQAALQVGSSRTRHSLHGDGSLLLLRGKRETDLAAYLATLLRSNPGFRPTCVVPDKNRSLDNALIHEGLPSLGILSASLARPTLQVLKLVTVFLWNPIDPFKVMEFVSLSVKPLDDELANRIALQMAQTPGLMGDGWQRAISAYFGELEQRARRDSSLSVNDIRRQYSFWFERPRYDISSTVPKGEVIGIFGYLERWAIEAFDQTGAKNQSLIVLYDQARRIRELLQTLPEARLSHLELERIVRTIYEPAPVQLLKQEKGHLPYVYQPNAIIGPVDRLVWWNFVQKEADHFFSQWYHSERQWLAGRGVVLEGPGDENGRLVWQRKCPINWTQKQLILVIPEFIDGSPVLQHPLLGNLEAAFGDLQAITCDIDQDAAAPCWPEGFDLPQTTAVPPRRLGRPHPFFILDRRYQLDRRPEETISSLESLFYYPYQWMFRHKLKLRKSSILSIVPDHTLLGNLAHRFFERLLAEEITHWRQANVHRWIEEQADGLLQREGAVLLLYGREPERVSFIRRVKYAAWSLVELIQSNKWQVVGIETPLAGHFAGMPLNGRADLVLEREGERAVVDLKWRGAAYRERLIRNGEDLQLVLYARLLTPDQSWAHTAYYIMDRGRMIARNKLAFEQALAVAPDADHLEVNQRIFQRMKATFQWRMEQIRQGRIEVRCAYNEDDLKEHYREELTDLLEMKTGDARWDDYRTLIYLVD